MRSSGITIGRILGIEIRIAYSWFILFFLIVTSFSTGFIPLLLPDMSGLETFVLSLALALAFFVSVLLHELTHSVYAKRTGLKIDRLTLFLFGGIAELKQEPTSPRQEFIMAGLGPLSSILIGLFFSGLWYVGVLINNEVLAASAGLLAGINIVLAVFNLLPGYPLDGGRLLRSVIWKITGSIEKATRIATNGGRAIGLLLIIYGLLQLIVGGLLGGIWLAFIGFFLMSAAELSYEQTIMHSILNRVRVKELMNEDFTSVPQSMPVINFIKDVVLKKKGAAYPLEPSSDTKMTGMVSIDAIDSDVEPLQTVGEFVKDGDLAVHPDDNITKALEIINDKGVSMLPVVKDSRVVGILALSNIQAYAAGMVRLRAIKG